MSINRAAGFGILAFGFAAALSFAPATVVKAQVILQPDSLQSGATTPKKLNDQIREGAKTQQARGTAAARYGVYTISWPKDEAERDQLASYAVVMVTVVTQKQQELPLQRVYLVAADGKETPLRQLNSWLGTIGPNTLTYTQLGKFRQDAFYTIPGAAVGRPGEVRLDFAINRVGFVLIHLPTTAQDLGYKLSDPAPGAQPNNAVLRAMIQREFP
ncbi:MAG TPA: hypothetical protein VN362_22845, partial [Xanthobacteraceae bacterium]|nr:hypothetical protein [Xanthobacteraceae bacterium]